MSEHLFEKWSLRDNLDKYRRPVLDRVGGLTEEELLAKESAFLASELTKTAFFRVPALPREYAVERGSRDDVVCFRLLATESVTVLNYGPSKPPVGTRPLGMAEGQEIVFELPATGRDASQMRDDARENIEKVLSWCDALAEEVNAAREQLLMDVTTAIAKRREAVRHTRETLEALGGSPDRRPSRSW